MRLDVGRKWQDSERNGGWKRGGMMLLDVSYDMQCIADSDDGVQAACMPLHGHTASIAHTSDKQHKDPPTCSGHDL